jgi:hypothetical protein
MYLQKYYHEGNGKLCFEHLETISDAQNNLPLAGGRKPFRSQVFVWI